MSSRRWTESAKHVSKHVQARVKTQFPPAFLSNRSRQNNSKNFDQKIIKCTGGKGADGFQMFRRERDQPLMGPDGGNGGNGGHVVVVGSKHHNTVHSRMSVTLGY